ncbi:DUF2007 domain-containing protein [Metallumcola ferriviriculae]|uniref:DUF2007 domain-containing protein n=1 Tax=Metallumcola ferriviriculae TaxID=3039180 RepID=A0AAU0UPU7_9FIRM|nr:DUF2007 domain-containing protein [Desulfitibacteraceae bacterium MK1]
MSDKKSPVAVYSTFDQVKMTIARSILEGAGIWSFVKGERVRNMPFNYLDGPMQIMVKVEDLEEVECLLQDFLEE